MALAKLKSDEETLLEFDVQVFGTEDNLSEVRFVIEGKKFDIVCKCEQTEDNNVQVCVPPLKGLMESGEYNVRLETIINDRIFTPLNESIEVLPLVEFKVTKKTPDAPKPQTVKVVSSKKKQIGLSSVKGKALSEALEAGATTEESNGAKFLKIGDKYAGLVVKENKIIFGNVLCESVEELIDNIEKLV